MSVTIRLQYLPLSASAADIRAFFHGLRIPDGAVHIVGGEDGDAFIGFASDEDGRQAMRRDRGRIHGSEVRLLLSSKQEMNDVISKVRAEVFGQKSPSMQSPRPALPVKQDVVSTPAWPPVNAVSPPGTTQPSRFAPDYSEASQPAYARAPSLKTEPEPYALPSGGYQANFATREQDRPDYYSRQGRGPPNVRQMNFPETEPYQASPIYQQRDPQQEYAYRASEDTSGKLAEYHQEPVRPEMSKAAEEAFAKLPPHLRPPHGIPPPHLRHLFPGFGIQQQPQPAEVRAPPVAPMVPPNRENEARPTYAPQETPAPSFNGHHDEKSELRNESWRDSKLPQREERPPWIDRNSQGDSRGRSRDGGRHWGSRDSYKQNGFSHGGPPQMAPSRGGRGPRPALLSNPEPAPIASSITSASRYAELSRLPVELLRPSTLEEFVKPSAPLSLTAVKVVYSPQGIHLHTLIRLDNEADFNRVLARDGDQGIRVRPTTKAIFDEAVDGLPPIAPVVQGGSSLPPPETKERDREERDKRRRSRSRSRDRGRSSKRSRSRSRDRSSRYSSRRTRRSPPRRGRQEPNRWCLQLTNVPFRVEPEEILAWMSERVKPSKLTRTFYADGNASDRWVAEFESESLMERARGQRTLLQGRTIKMQYIDNDYADEILAIEDRYGENRKREYDMKQMAELQLQHLNGTLGPHGVPRFFNNPAATRPNVPQTHFMGGPRQQPANFGSPSHGPGSTPLLTSPGPFPVDGRGGGGRGGFGGRGRGGLMGGPPYHGPPGFPRKLFHGRQGEFSDNPAEDPSKFSSKNSTEAKSEDNIFASLGPAGTVISCEGFPSDVTLQEIVEFFHGFPVDENSVRIRMGENGVGTGEAVLCVPDPEKAKTAVASLHGKSVRGRTVSLAIATV